MLPTLTNFINAPFFYYHCMSIRGALTMYRTPIVYSHYHALKSVASTGGYMRKNEEEHSHENKSPYWNISCIEKKP